ncbi:Doa1p NDAI_0G00150 [Naumovozyma dairenensis CBS 421]|uniref:Protein DOA1 n=1 Tax=Naumovozyma dairenensis (strain ATCC 10597 / BCRC 20456 / CBS 421 / NBRC 0211 / NRRL Y-12639) TaxID=1071378 RepID=G0WDD0_NAUDC|nr:hypothetical protein NDAI_0G00150 [Naumovozyma dairenensis CBS 421]CCD25791.2 hypothetical protein NDAI_0G00150 [Naumovozyma dairenensis CBS 421]
MSTYQLRATLRGHRQDVKDVVAIDDTKIASVSRDGTVRLWTNDPNDPTNWSDTILATNEKYLNALTYDEERGIIFYSGQDSIVNGVLLSSNLEEDPIFTLVGHESNVCSLEMSNETLVSGSWDKTAKVWQNGSLKYDLKGHEASVWCAKSFPGVENKYVSVSADQTIKIWENNVAIKTLGGIHTDVIRRVEISKSNPNEIITCSNDSTIKLSNIESGEIIRNWCGHESFVYSVKQFNLSNDLVSCGEDRSVIIWDSNNSGPKQVIKLPAVSIWSIDILPNDDIIIGSSDQLIRIFTKNETRMASPEAMKELAEEVSKISINAQTMGFDESKVSPYEVLNAPGKKEGQVVVVRAPTGALEAHLYSSNHWSKVGDVVGSGGATGNDQKTEYEGKLYDYVFDVDIQEGVPPLKLPINVSDNPYTVADHFIAKYELSPSYKNDIVNFILKNTNGMSFDEVPTELNKNTETDKKWKILPIKTYLSLRNYNADSIFNGIVKFNSKEKTFDDEQIATIGADLQDADENWEALYSYAVIIRSKWENKTPAYDILRLIVQKLPAAVNLAEFVEEGLGNKSISIVMLTVRMLANCFENQIWGLELMSSNKVYESIFETIDVNFENATKKQAQNLALAVSTLILNYSVRVVQSGTEKLDIGPVVIEAMNTKYAPLEEYQENEEAAYRLVVAYGNFATVEPTLRHFAKSISWLLNVKKMYGIIPRFKDIFDDLD